MGNRADGAMQNEGPGSQPFAVVLCDLAGLLTIIRMDAHTIEHAANAAEFQNPETRAMFVREMIKGRCERCSCVVRADSKWQIVGHLLRCEDCRR